MGFHLALSIWARYCGWRQGCGDSLTQLSGTVVASLFDELEDLKCVIPLWMSVLLFLCISAS